jgi:hypothetical protein
VEDAGDVHEPFAGGPQGVPRIPDDGVAAEARTEQSKDGPPSIPFFHAYQP